MFVIITVASQGGEDDAMLELSVAHFQRLEKPRFGRRRCCRAHSGVDLEAKIEFNVWLLATKYYCFEYEIGVRSL